MIRDLSGHDPTRFGEIGRVRVRDALEAYVARCRERATHAFEHAQLVYVMGGMRKKPEVPAILKDR